MFNNATLICEIPTTSDEKQPETTYSWHRVDGGGDDDIQKKAKGKKSAKLIIPSVVPEDEGEYYCIAERYGHCGKADKIKLTVDGEMIIQCNYRHIATGFYAAIMQQLIMLQKILLHKL